MNEPKHQSAVNFGQWLQIVMLAVLVLTLIAAFAASTCPALAYSAQAPSTAPAKAQWLNLPKATTWDREQYLHQLEPPTGFKGRARAEVLRALGDPGYSSANSGRTMDEYRLSSKNDRILQIDYDKNGKVDNEWIDDRACECPDCAATAPILSYEALKQSGLFRLDPDEPGTHPTLRRLEKHLGQPGKRRVFTTHAGARAFLAYTITWRLKGKVNHFLVEEGLLDHGENPLVDVDNSRIGSWSLVTFTPACLP